MTDGTVLITAENQTIGIHFGMQSVMAIQAEGILEGAVKGESEGAFLSSSMIVKMAYHGYLNWCLYEDTKAEMNKKQFIDFFDSVVIENSGIYQDIFNAFESSKPLQKLKERQKKMTDEKNQAK